MNIITHPNPILRQKSLAINPEQILNSEFKKFVKDMGKIMLKKDGAGLAAPQVGKNIRVIIIETENGPQAYINPKILKKSWRKNVMEEGCLSIPGVFGKVKRSTTICLEYSDLETKKHKIKTSGLLARVFQHEIDHLDGILFIDKIQK